MTAPEPAEPAEPVEPVEPVEPGLDAFAAALVEEACKRSALVWVEVVGAPATRPRPVWHAWHDRAACLVTDGLEQRLPGLEDGADVVLTARSKDKGGRLVTVAALAQEVVPEDEGYDALLAVLHGERLNPPDGEAQPERWRRESRVWRLRPSALLEAPGAMPDGSGAAPPPGSPATTRGRGPARLGRRPRRRPLG